MGTAAVLSIGSSAAAEAAGRAAPALADLTVTAVKWAPLDPVGGQQVRFSAIITNRGTAPTPQGTISGVAFEVDGVKRTWSDDRTTPLAPGESVTVTANGGPTGAATWSATAGAHTVRAVVDDVARIRESREDNNTLTQKMAVASGLSIRPGGGTLLVGLAPISTPTVLTTSITGDLFAGCAAQDGVLIDGSERFVSSWTFGRNNPNYGGKFNDGVAMIPAGLTRTQAGVDLTSVRYAYQGRAPITCPAGQSYRWTILHATSITATRWPGQFGADGAAVASVTVPLDNVLVLNTF